MTKSAAVEAAKAKALEVALAAGKPKTEPKAPAKPKAAAKAPAKAEPTAAELKALAKLEADKEAKALAAAKAKQEAKEAADKAKGLTKIATKINTLGKQVAEKQLAIGVLLLEAKDLHPTAKAFVEWSEEVLGYKKAYTYRLISVAERFGSEEAFEGVAIRVLHILAGLPEEVQEAAKDIAKAGALDTDTVNALKDAVQGKPNTEPKPLPAKGSTEEEEELQNAIQEEQEALQEAEIESLFERPDAVVLPKAKATKDEPKLEPKEVEGLDIAPWLDQEEELLAPSLPVQDGGLEDRLLTIIAGLQEELAQAKKQELPALPQFNNTDLAARLGLTHEQAKDKKQVRAAYNGLEAIGYNVKHSSHALLAQALKGLLAQ